MIAKLRKRHRLSFTIMAPALVCLYALSLYFRHPLTKNGEESASLSSPAFSSRRSGEAPQERITLLNKKLMDLEKLRTVVRTWKSDSGYWLSLDPQGKPWSTPDLLLYVQEGASKKLSPKAYFLGTLIDRKENWFMLPQDRTGNSSYGQKAVFILYSLGHSRVISSFHSRGKLP